MAFYFDGVDPTLKSAANGVPGIDSAQFSQYVRAFKTNSSQGNMFIIGTDLVSGALSSTIDAAVPTTSGIRFEFFVKYSGGARSWITDADYSLSQWYDILATLDTSNSSNLPVIYINGLSVAITLVNSGTGTFVPGDTIVFGENVAGSGDYTGYMAGGAYWNRILSASEAAMISNGRTPAFVPRGRKFYMPMVRELTEVDQGISMTSTVSNITHPRTVNPAPAIIYPSFTVPTADVIFAEVTTAIPTSLGIQKIVAPDLGGQTPMFAMFLLSYATADATPRNGRVMGFGVTDGTRQWAASTAANHNVSPSVTRNRSKAGACICQVFVGSSSADGEAAFDSFIANGVNIEWTNAAASAFLLTTIFIAGTDAQAYVDTVTTGNVDVPVVVSAPNFQPDLLLTNYNHNKFADTGTNALNESFGLVHYDGAAVTTRSISNRVNNNNTTEQVAQYLSTLYGLAALNSSGVPTTGFVYDAFTSVGFSITPKLVNASYKTGYAALKFANKSVKVGTISSPTANGNDAQTGFGFTPDYMQQYLSMLLAVDAAKNNDDAGTFAINSVCATSEQCVAITDNDNSNPSDTASESTAKAISINLANGNAGMDATLVSLDSDGYTFNYTKVQTTTRVSMFFAVGAVPNITVSPSPISSAAATVIDSPVLGSISKAPTALSAAAATVSPTISQGSLLVGMQALAAATGVVAPTVIHSLIGITPAALSAAAATISPTTIFGTLLITPAALAAAASTVAPTTQTGSITASPSPAIARALAVDGVILGGNVIISMPFIDAATSTIAPSVIQNSMVVSPTALAAAAATVDPTIAISGIIFTPPQISGAVETIAPDILLSSITASLTPAVAKAISNIGSILQSSILFPATSASAGADSLLSGVKVGPIIINPPIATAKTDIVQPSVVIFVLIKPIITSITEVIYATFITEISHETYLKEVKPTDVVIKTSNETIIYRIA